VFVTNNIASSFIHLCWLQALGACRGIFALESTTSNTKRATLSAKYWIALIEYLWFTIQIHVKVLIFSSMFRPKDDGAARASHGL
jgi:hypothetical protein